MHSKLYIFRNAIRLFCLFSNQSCLQLDLVKRTMYILQWRITCPNVSYLINVFLIVLIRSSFFRLAISKGVPNSKLSPFFSKIHQQWRAKKIQGQFLRGLLHLAPLVGMSDPCSWPPMKSKRGLGQRMATIMCCGLHFYNAPASFCQQYDVVV